MSLSGPIRCPFYIAGKIDAERNIPLRKKLYTETEENYLSYAKGYANYKGVYDSVHENHPADVSLWPEIAAKEYNTIYIQHCGFGY
jgi:hypothetical protein